MTLYRLLRGIMRRMRCSSCGAYSMASLLVDWTSDGLIRHAMPGYEPPPSIIIEVEEFRNIFQSLEEALGFNIDHIVTESERKATIAWFRDALEIFPRFLFRSNTFAGLLWSAAMLMVDYSGQGHQELIRVTDRSRVMYYCKSPFYFPAVIGDRQATTEGFFAGRYTAKGMGLIDEDYLIVFTSSEEATGVEERLEYVTREIIEGSVEFERCPECGVPGKANNYVWNLENGIITNSLTGLREVLIANWSVDVICREITEELGEDIPRIIIEAERDFTADRVKQYGLSLSHAGHTELKEDNAENLRILLDDLPFRGMGYVEDLTLEGDELRLRVNNPLNEALLCGKVLGYYEALIGKKGKVDWSIPPGEWAVEIDIVPG